MVRMYTLLETQDWLIVIDVWISTTIKIDKLGSNEDLLNIVNNNN